MTQEKSGKGSAKKQPGEKEIFQHPTPMFDGLPVRLYQNGDER